MDNTTRLAGLVCFLSFGLSISTAQAQTPYASTQVNPIKSASAKFFVGAGLEGTGLVTAQPSSASVTESGAGVGLVLGYGFTPTWAVYGDLSGANMSA